METAILKDYEKLNCDGRFFVECALKGAVSTPAYLKTTSEEEMQETEHKQEDADRAKKLENEKRNQYFEELKAECNTMTKDDYIDRLNEVFAELPTYKLRYFFMFINAKLSYDVKGGVCHE